MTDELKKQKRFFLKHKKSSALVVSIVIHAAFAVVAIVFIAVQVATKEEAVFEAKEVARKPMKLRKLQVPVKDSKKSQAPKLRKTIVSKPKTMVSIKMPEITGVPGGVGYGSGTGLGGGVGFGTMDLFGGGRGSGNELIGTFYDLKQKPDGSPTEIGQRASRNSFSRDVQLLATKVINGFISSGCNPRRLEDYYKAPKLKYATTFMMPPMPADAAPKAYGVEDQVKPSYWLCHYTGQIAAPETGRYRFCGIGDDILIVRLGRRVALDASWPELIGEVTSWESDAKNSRKYSVNGYKYGSFPAGVWEQMYEQLDDTGVFDGNMVWSEAIRQVNINGRTYFDTPNYMRAASRMEIGDWVSLRKGERVDIDIIVSEIPGGEFSARLLIEQEGTNYRMVDGDMGPRPVLPVFQTKSIANDDLVKQMEIDPNEMTLDGPVFGAQINSN